jgi:hypothetical protein
MHLNFFAFQFRIVGWVERDLHDFCAACLLCSSAERFLCGLPACLHWFYAACLLCSSAARTLYGLPACLLCSSAARTLCGLPGCLLCSSAARILCGLPARTLCGFFTPVPSGFRGKTQLQSVFGLFLFQPLCLLTPAPIIVIFTLRFCRR